MMHKRGAHPGAGAQVGRYVLGDQIGAGGMATVYRGIDPHGDVYAIKILNPAAVLPEDVKRFTREYRALARMDHPNIVRVYESGIHDGYPWISMEYVEGVDLEKLIERWRAAPPADRFVQVEAMLRQLCSALQYVHNHNLIHRDIKPSNILVTSEGIAKLSDFGVVKGAADASTHITQLTMAGRLVGTVAFMAPELITSDDDIDHRADLYSLGAMLYLMLCFRRPIEAKSVAGYLARHLTEVPRPVGEVDPDVPRNMERVCARLLLKDPTSRYASAGAVITALDCEGDLETPPLRGRDRQLQGWSRRVGALLDGGGGCVVINGAADTGKTSLLVAMAEVASTTRAKTLTAVDWEFDPIDDLARDAGIDPEGSLGAALSRAVVAYLGKSPAILAIDRLDAAPKRTIDALGRLLKDRCAVEGEPLLLLATATSLDAIANLVNGHATGFPADLIPVGSVDISSAVSMMRDRGVMGAAAGILGRRLHADYAGIPGAMCRQLQTLIDHEWFERQHNDLRCTLSLTELRNREMPVPKEEGEALAERVTELERADRELISLLAVLDRPAGPAFVGRCLGDVNHAARAMEGLCRQGFLTPSDDDAGERFQFANPSAARVVRQQLSPTHRVELHRQIATALSGRRRRTRSLEVAYHLQAAGEVAKAYPLYVSAAVRAGRKGTPTEVLDITGKALDLQERAEAELPPDQAARLRRQLMQLRGEVLLGRGEYEGARTLLKRALKAAREEGEPVTTGQVLCALGRVYYRLHHHDRARPLLREALQLLPERDPVRGHGLRALADVELQDGGLERSETLWNEALQLAQENDSADNEARACRGLAHLRIFQGRLSDAVKLLDEADDLLSLNGDPLVRASVLSRMIELLIFSGRWGAAVRRAELLVDIARRRELSERLPEAYSLLAQVLVGIGANEDAYDAVAQVKVFARACPHKVEPRLRAARVLLDLGRYDEVAEVLPPADGLPESRIGDLQALHGALRARLLAPETPRAAADLAVWCLRREKKLLGFDSALVALDTSRALLVAGHARAARKAAKRGLKMLKGLGGDGMRLEMLIALQRASPDPRVIDALRAVASRIMARLPAAARVGFSNRSVVAEALDHAGVGK